MMKNLLLIILSSICFNICIGQNELLLKRNPHRSIKSHEIPKSTLAQTRLFSDLNEQLDSVWIRQLGPNNEWFSAGTRYFTYTPEHLLASESLSYFDLDDGVLEFGEQEEYFYNDLGLCTLYYRNDQDLNSGAWLRNYREELVWSEAGIFEEVTRSAWNKNLMQFEYTEKLTWSNTTSQQTEEVVWYLWDGTAWKIEVRYEYEYNNADSIQAINEYKLDENSGEWYLDFKTEYFYTNDTQLDSIIKSSDSGLGLEPYSKDILTFNEQGLPLSDIYFEWDGSQWEPLAMDESVYTPDGKETLFTHYEWDTDEQRFIKDSYEENLFTAAGDLMKYTYADYDRDAEVWDPWWIDDKFYDENVDGSTLVWPNPFYYEPVSFHHKPVMEVLSLNDNGWFIGDTTLFFYGSITTATIPVSEMNIKVFPNPASNQMTIQMEELGPGATITFFDQQGKFAATRPLQSNVPVSISGLIPGSYVYRIRNGTEFYSGKILKE